MATLINGKEVSLKILEDIRAQSAIIEKERGRAPHLGAILVGNDPASETYVSNKIKACEQAGFKSSLFRFETHVTEQELIAFIYNLNNDEQLDGFIVQLPLPSHINVPRVTEAISPLKDVDGFHPFNTGRMMQQMPCFLPATPKGIVRLLEWYRIETAGKHCVVVGRSQIVGTPVSVLLSRNTYPGNCTVTLCHSRTANLASYTRNADILIAAIGIPEFVTGDMIKQGAVVIDVGMSRATDASSKSGFKLKGDVEFIGASQKASYITPVPGGVGPMTIISLLENTLMAAKKIIKPDAFF